MVLVKGIYEYSGYGDKVDVHAPAELIYYIFYENSQDYVSGTSLSVALVTGSIALVESIEEMDCAEIKSRLKSCKRCLDLEMLAE